MKMIKAMIAASKARATLANLSDYHLADIGITRAEIYSVTKYR